MSQIDYVHFLPSLVWVVCLFFCFYFFITGIFIPELYKVNRVRKEYLRSLSQLLNILLYNRIIVSNLWFTFKFISLREIVKYILKGIGIKIKIVFKCI